ncbi:DMT family transporter [Allobranchiibius huperziae]|uniref:Uncharacterized protein n=1 Tax=Allobranchiibius huperziae TaxID=1874116 RepID=A0A853DAZ9_9MICO|nr:DMT family transporter [Allobranchiibius huperziae]NYJ73777.1 hypothetical protein [Allobranchiibius huperziae]
MMLLVIALALAAAFTFALSAMIEQQEAHAQRATGQHEIATVRGFAGFIRHLLTRRRWLFGWLINMSGFGIQAAALQLGTVAIVQPIMTMQIFFALLLSTGGSRDQPRRRDFAFGLSICAGLVVLLTVGRAAPLRGSPDRDRVALILVLIAATVVLLVVVARRTGGMLASFLLATGAGMCFAASAVLMKLTSASLFGPGVLATAKDWPGYTLALSTLGGLLLEQAAFSQGSLPWPFAAMSITNPIVSYCAGIFGFHVEVPHSPPDLLAVALTGTLLIIGITGLSHSPLVRHADSSAHPKESMSPS